MRIAEVAAELGISTDWLRRLERQKVVPPAPRDRNGHRRYTDEHLQQLRELLFPATQGGEQR